MQEPASRNMTAGCKSPTRKSLRYGDGAYSPHPKFGIHPLTQKFLAELAEGFEPPTL